MRYVVTAALALLLASPALAQGQSSPADKTTIIHAGQLLAEPGKPARGPSSIVIHGDKIGDP